MDGGGVFIFKIRQRSPSIAHYSLSTAPGKMRQFYAILTNTFWEAVRQPAYGLVLIIVALLVLAAPLSGAHIYTLAAGDHLSAQRAVAGMGLSTVLIAGLGLAVLIAAGVINREIEEKTALTVLTKAVGRLVFITGKFAGVAAAITLAVAAWSMLILLTARFGANVAAYENFDYASFGGTMLAIGGGLAAATWRNYFSGKSWVGSFSLTFFGILSGVFLALLFVTPDYQWAFGGGKFGAYDWQVALAALLMWEAILLLAGLAVAFSTRLKMTANFALCLGLFAGGLTVDYFYATYGGEWLAAGRMLVPAVQALWLSEALKYEVAIPLTYVADCTAYAALYLAATLFLAAYLFEKREIAG